VGMERCAGAGGGGGGRGCTAGERRDEGEGMVGIWVLARVAIGTRHPMPKQSGVQACCEGRTRVHADAQQAVEDTRVPLRRAEAMCSNPLTAMAAEPLIKCAAWGATGAESKDDTPTVPVARQQVSPRCSDENSICETAMGEHRQCPCCPCGQSNLGKKRKEETAELGHLSILTSHQCIRTGVQIALEPL
jgi:hypothetical protein